MNSFAIICYLFDIMVLRNTHRILYEIFHLKILVYLFIFNLFQQGILHCRYSTIPTIICAQKAIKSYQRYLNMRKKIFLENITCSMQRKQFLLNLAREIPALEF